MNRRTRERIDSLEAEVAHKDRLHKALLDGHDAITEQHHGAKLAAELLARDADLLARDADLLDTKLRHVRAYAENLLGSGSSAYRKAGTRLLEILEAPDADNQPEHEASA